MFSKENAADVFQQQNVAGTISQTEGNQKKKKN